jgi:hypothetical protein
MTIAARYQRWVQSSYNASKYELDFLITVRELGRIDIALLRKDEKIMSTAAVATQKLDSHRTMSYFWTLGANDVVRTIQHRLGSNSVPPVCYAMVDNVKKIFEKISIPLNAAKQQEACSIKIAYPIIHERHGTGWYVPEEGIVTRKELSDSLLAMLEQLH